SSTVLDAVLLKKKIINVNSNYSGHYFKYHGDKFVKSLGLISVNIDKKFNLKKKSLNYEPNKYKIFIKQRLIPDKDLDPNLKIINTIKKHFNF
ncbi:hypothetical protein N8824_01505, partial [Candidatus Pelagibacter sp.]|nr:hypothetical protein [Candidatus Pelagibacter sp.]